MTKEALVHQIVVALKQSGLGYDDQVKAISMARVAIQPRASEGDWRVKAKPILKPKEKGKKVEK
jgi:hypothetical protein